MVFGDWRLRYPPFVLLIGLAACAEIHHHPAGRVAIAPGLTLMLPLPGDLGRVVESAQLVSARYAEKTYVFEGRVSASAGRFLLVGVDSLGRRLMTITWTDDGVSHEASPWLPGELSPENILADMVLIYWPEHAVRQALAGSTATLLDAPGQRTISDGEQEIIRIEYAPSGEDGSPWTGRIRLHHLIWNYQLDVRSREVGS